MNGTIADFHTGHIDHLATQIAELDDLVDLQQKLENAESDARDIAAILELIAKAQAADDLRHGCYILANELKSHLKCKRVAIGLRRRSRESCRLWAVSGLAQFDKRSEFATKLEAAFDEAILRDSPAFWPPFDDTDQHSDFALKALCAHDDSCRTICSPLHDEQGNVVGAWLFEQVDASHQHSPAINLIVALQRPIATCLRMLTRLERGPVTQLLYSLGRFARTHKGKAILAALLLVLASLAIPVPHKIKCDCRLEPVKRRFVAVPFEGTLEESMVKPGDLVSQGDLLARMDGREIRWERAGLVADHSQAAKKRDSELASRNYAAAQLAKLEMERLELQIKLLEHRAENLEIKSPINGVVTSGDLERAEGAPLAIGETLFEIAPLNEMVVEIAVPQDDVSYVNNGQQVTVRLDSYPGKSWQLTLDKIQPRSELRDNANVFIGESSLPNDDLLLRPGMDGRAKILNSKKPLGWILFHKPWESLMSWLGW